MTSKKELKCTTVRCVFPRRQTGFLFFFTVHTSFVLSKNMRGKQHFNPKESQRPRAANAPQFMQKEQSHWTQSCFMSVSFASVGASQIGVQNLAKGKTICSQDLSYSYSAQPNVPTRFPFNPPEYTLPPLKLCSVIQWCLSCLHPNALVTLGSNYHLSETRKQTDLSDLW